MDQNPFKLGDLIISVAECANDTCTMHPCAPTREYLCNRSTNLLDMTLPQLQEMKHNLALALEAIVAQEARVIGKTAPEPTGHMALKDAGTPLFVAFTVENPPPPKTGA